MLKFKLGDRFMSHDEDVGEVSIIEVDDESSFYPYLIKSLNEDYDDWITEDDLESEYTPIYESTPEIY